MMEIKQLIGQEYVQEEVGLVTAALERAVELMGDPQLTYLDRIPVVAGGIGVASKSVVYPVLQLAGTRNVDTSSVYEALIEYFSNKRLNNCIADWMLGPVPRGKNENFLIGEGLNLNFRMLGNVNGGEVRGIWAVERSGASIWNRRLEIDLGGEING